MDRDQNQRWERVKCVLSIAKLWCTWVENGCRFGMGNKSSHVGTAACQWRHQNIELRIWLLFCQIMYRQGETIQGHLESRKKIKTKCIWGQVDEHREQWVSTWWNPWPVPTNRHSQVPTLGSPYNTYCKSLLWSAHVSQVQFCPNSFFSIPPKIIFNTKYIIPKMACQIVLMLHS